MAARAKRIEYLMVDSEVQDYTAQEIDLIMDFIHTKLIRTIHYSGLGDRGLIEAILSSDELILTLMFYHCSRPDWLKDGIASYEEGGPAINDCTIFDVRWTTPDTLNKILTWELKPRRPRYFILAKEAIEDGFHHFYEWQKQNNIYFGELKNEHVLKLAKEERVFLKKQDTHMRGE